MLFSRLRKDKSGATAVEYAIMVAAIAATIIAIVFVIGIQTQSAFDTVADAIENGVAGTCCD